MGATPFDVSTGGSPGAAIPSARSWERERLVPLPAWMLRETSRSHAVALLDLDGTLLDSNAAHASAWHEAIVAAGYPPVPIEKLRALIGVGADKLLRFALGVDRRDSEWRRITALRRRLFREKYLDTLQPFPGVTSLLRALRDAGWQPVIATSASSDEVDGLIRRAGVAHLVTDVVSASHYMPSKPDPDLFELALRRLQSDRESAKVLGDTPYDLMAATRARIRSVALRCGGWSDTALAAAEAIFDDPLDLVRRFESSPFAAGARNAGRVSVGAQ